MAKNEFYFWDSLIQFMEPKPRKNHATTTIKDDLIFVYGGTNDKDEMLSDYWVYNTKNQLWFPVEPSSKLSKRIGCTLTTINNEIYMFGGEK